MPDMIEVKVAEAEGHALDYLAALAVGYEVDVKTDHQGGEHLEVVRPGEIQGQPYRKRIGWIRSVHPAWAYACGEAFWRPTVDWNQAGPLIDRFEIELFISATAKGRRGAGINGRCAVVSDSYLLSAMRVLVRAELGDTVAVPAELQRKEDNPT